jgi:1,4-dihydroxy-2-naphthoate octaprenyltransferase
MNAKSTITPNQRLKAWLSLSRLPFHSVGVLPFLLGVILAWSQGYSLNWAVLFFSILAVIFIMLTTYLTGEYYDYETDAINVDYNKYSGGSRVLQVGLIPRRHALIATYISLASAGAIGFVLYFYYETGPYTIPLGAFGLLCGYFYTAKPFQWSYRGIGELLIAICYGWLTVNAAYYLQVGHFSLTPALVSIPLAIAIFLVILINEFPDYISDKLSGKRTLVVRFGRERMAILYSLLLMTCYLAIIPGLFYGVPWIVAPLSVLLLPLLVVNVMAIKGRGYERAKVLEGICARTILLDLMLSGIYILAFILARGVPL